MTPSCSISPEVQKTIQTLAPSTQKYVYSLITDILHNRAKAKKKYYGQKTNNARNEYTFPLPEAYLAVMTFDLHYCYIISVKQTPAP